MKMAAWIVSQREDLIRIYEQTKTIAVIGASRDAAKPGHVIPEYLQAQGYRILPVNPRGGELFGEHVYASLSDIEVPIDVVDVFRPPSEAAAIARAAIATETKVLWYQPGTETNQALRLASDAGLIVVAGRCMGATHGELRLGHRGGTERTKPTCVLDNHLPGDDSDPRPGMP